MVQNKPGLLDAQTFKLHWSVDFWRDFSVPPSIADPNTPIPSRYFCMDTSHRNAINMRLCQEPKCCSRYASQTYGSELKRCYAAQAAGNPADPDRCCQQYGSVLLFPGRCLLGVPHHPVQLLCHTGHCRRVAMTLLLASAPAILCESCCWQEVATCGPCLRRILGEQACWRRVLQAA